MPTFQRPVICSHTCSNLCDIMAILITVRACTCFLPLFPLLYIGLVTWYKDTQKLILLRMTQQTWKNLTFSSSWSFYAFVARLQYIHSVTSPWKLEENVANNNRLTADVALHWGTHLPFTRSDSGSRVSRSSRQVGSSSLHSCVV